MQRKNSDLQQTYYSLYLSSGYTEVTYTLYTLCTLIVNYPTTYRKHPRLTFYDELCLQYKEPAYNITSVLIMSTMLTLRIRVDIQGEKRK